MNGLIQISIRDFRGIVEFSAKPDGKSLALRGKNGAGKSGAIDALFWALGGKLDGEVVRNGAERATVEVDFAGYQIRRAQTKGKAASLTVKDASGRPYASPAALLAGFLGAVERQTFSARKPKEQAEILRRLAPGLDCGDLEEERARVYEERTGVNRDAKSLRAQAEGVVVPAAPASIGEEQPIVDVVDVAAIVERKAEVATVRAANDAQRAAARQARARVVAAEAEAQRAMDAVIAAEEALRKARAAYDAAAEPVGALGIAASEAEQAAALLVDPDTSAIDIEIANAKQANAAARAEAEAHNRIIRSQQAQQTEHDRATKERQRLELAAAGKEAESKRLTDRIDAIDADKAKRLAAAKLPIAGIALAGDVVTFDDGKHGAVEIAALNTATQARVDVAVSAAQGLRLIAVRNASLLDDDSRAALSAFARDHGVQTIAEVVASGEPLTAVIEEAGADGAEPDPY